MQCDRIRRREFIALLGGAAALSSGLWPLAAGAQARRLPTIGFLLTGSRLDNNSSTAAFAQRLRELGWIEGRTVAIEYRWGESRNQRYAEIAAEFVRLKVDVIVTQGAAVPAAKQATSIIPIVFVAADPVGTGLVASLARPGGNATGVSLQMTDLAGKRVELLREVVPGLRRLAFLANVSVPNVVLATREAQAAARTLGVEATTVEIRRAEDIATAFETLKQHADALYVVGDPLIAANRVRISTLAAVARLPTMQGGRQSVEAGSLMSYGPNDLDLHRRSADYVDKILRGTKPADIPVEQPTKFELVVNLTTAKAIGLTVPETFLVRADEVIE